MQKDREINHCHLLKGMRRHIQNQHIPQRTQEVWGGAQKRMLLVLCVIASNPGRNPWTLGTLLMREVEISCVLNQIIFPYYDPVHWGTFLVQCCRTPSYRAIGQASRLQEFLTDMYTATSSSTFTHMITPCEMKCPICQNKGSSLALKWKKKKKRQTQYL